MPSRPRCTVPRRAWQVVVLAIGLLSTLPSVADTWGLPTRTTTLSANGDACFTMTPHLLPAPTFSTPPTGQLEIRTGDTWRSAWKRTLVNETAPVSTLVATGGRYVVTFDEHHRLGHGDVAVVIYDASGKLVRKLGLDDFLPPRVIAALWHSTSSIHWGGEHVLSADGETLVLQVTVPKGLAWDEDTIDVPIHVRLRDGAVLPPSGPGWKFALAIGEWRHAQVEADRLALRYRRTLPLSAPRPGANPLQERVSTGGISRPLSASAKAELADEFAWVDYLREVRYRRWGGEARESWMGPWSGNDNEPRFLRNILRGSAGDPAPSYRYVLAGSRKPGEGERMLLEALQPVAAGSLKRIRIDFIGTPAQRERVQAAVARTGAQFGFIDVGAALPGVPVREQDARAE